MTEKEPPLQNQPDQAQRLHYDTEEASNFSNFLASIIKYKVFILTITSIFTLFAILYAKQLPPIYQASIGLMEPNENYWSNLPTDIANLLTGQERSLFAQFSSRLLSISAIEDVFENEDYLKKFHGENSTLSQEEAALSAYNSLSQVKDEIPEYKAITIQMEGTNPRVMAEFLTALAKSTKESIINEFKNQLKGIINFKIQQITAQIRFLNSSAEKQEAKQITVFSEALKIAEELGIEENNFKTAKGSPLWFLYGSKALRLELQKSKNRTLEQVDLLSRDWDLDGLSDKENELETLKSFNLSQINFKVYDLSRPSFIPKSPIRPNKITIVLQGMAFGLFIGIAVAVLRSELNQLKKV